MSIAPDGDERDAGRLPGHSRWPQIAVIAALGMALSMTAIMLHPSSGAPRVFLNVSASMPLGFYRAIGGTVGAGSLVEFPSSVIPSFGLTLPRFLLKRVETTGGADVLVDRLGLHIGGVLVARRVKNIGIRFKGRLPVGKVVVLGENPKSFDSRYFGPVPRRDLTVVAPILTW